MQVTQYDIARLADDELEGLVVGLLAAVENEGPCPASEYMRGFGEATVRAVQERRRLLLLSEADYLTQEG